MNKKLKIVSALGCAGIMSLSALASTTLAANITSNGKTQILGAYDNLEGVKNAVPVVLDNTESNNFVTSDQIKERFSGASNFSKTGNLGTGDTFQVGSNKYTVVLFGDVDGDGRINSTDSRMIKEDFFGTKALTGAQKVAADVAERDGKINSTDSARIKKFFFNTEKTVVDKVPDGYVEVGNYDYELSVEKTYINNQNSKNVKLVIKTDKDLSEQKTFNVFFGKVGKETNSNKTITLEAHQRQNSVDIGDLSSQDDGYVSIKLVPNGKNELGDKNENVVAATTVLKNTVNPVEVLVSTNRVDTKNATADFEFYGKNKAAKLYYSVDGIEEENDAEKLVKTAEFKDNKVSIKTSDLTKQAAGYIHYIIEDEYGNKTVGQSAPEVDIKKATITEVNAKTLKPVTSVTAPTSSNKNITWKVPDNETTNNLQIVVYKDGKVYDVISDLTGSSTAYDFATFKSGKYEPGTYRVEITVKSSSPTSQRDSAVAKSEDFVVKSLDKVTNIKFGIDEAGRYMVTWDDDKNKEVDLSDYNIELWKKDETNAVDSAFKTREAKTKSAEIDSTKLEKNTLYTVKIVSKSQPNNALIVDSEEAVSEEFFVIGVEVEPDDVTTGQDTVTLTVNNIADITKAFEDSTPVYEVEVYEILDSNNPVTGSKFVTKKTVSIDADGKIKIDGLKPDTQYAFKLYVTIDGVTGETADFIGGTMDNLGEIRTKRASLSVNNLKVVDNENEAKKEGTIYISEDAMYINGNKLITDEVTDDNYEEDFVDLYTYLTELTLNEGDVVVSATTSELSIKLAASESNDDSVIIPQIDDKELKVTIEGTSDERDIFFASGNKNDVTLKGEGTLFTIDSDGAMPNKLTLENGISVNSTVSGGFAGIIKGGATVTLNGKVITVDKDAEVGSDGNNNVIAVYVDGESTTNYKFDNADGKNLELKFESKNGVGTDNLKGSIDIVTHNGTVKVCAGAKKPGISGNINVKVSGETDTNGVTINLADNYLSGDIKITSEGNKGDITVKVLPKTTAPTEFTANTQISVDATDEEIKTTFNITGTGTAEINKLNAIKNYLKAIGEEFGITGTGAKVKVNSSDNDVEIVFPKPE